MRWGRFFAAVAVVLVVGVYLGVPAFAQPAHSAVAATPGGTESLSVSASAPFHFSTSVTELAPGENVTVTLTNLDVLAHTWTLASTANYQIPDSYTPDQLSAFFVAHPPLASFNFSTTQGGIVDGMFMAPSTGWYEFVCVEPGHFQEGMYGFLAFGEPLPGNLTVSAPNMGPGAAVFIIVGTIVSLVVIAVVLGFIVGQRRGQGEEMPPERLGYPEPDVKTPSTPLPPSDSSHEH